MSLGLKLLLVVVIIGVAIESAQTSDLKEIAKALRQKRENEIALQQKEETALLLRNKRRGGGGGGGGGKGGGGGGGCGGGKGGGGGGGCGGGKGGGGGGGGCGCCCCCCCCCCGCGKKKRDIMSVLRGKRNSLNDDMTKIAANDWASYSGSSDFEQKGFGTGRGDEVISVANGGGDDDGNCAECDE